MPIISYSWPVLSPAASFRLHLRRLDTLTLATTRSPFNPQTPKYTRHPVYVALSTLTSSHSPSPSLFPISTVLPSSRFSISSCSHRPARMDHLSSRFRRIKKQSSPASPTTTLAGSPPDRSPLESKLNSGGQREPPSTVAPPTLTIPTGQPISNAPKSPFRRGFTFRHSNKRARSPAPPQPPPVPAIVSQDGTVEHDKSTLLKDDDKTGQGATEEKPKPKMPAFLNLSENGT